MFPSLNLPDMITQRARKVFPKIAEEDLQQILAASDALTRGQLESFRAYIGMDAWILATSAEALTRAGLLDEKGEVSELGHRFYESTCDIPPQLWPDRLS